VRRYVLGATHPRAGCFRLTNVIVSQQYPGN
jgi:hypothetical protein